jgi:hypothetical protein
LRALGDGIPAVRLAEAAPMPQRCGSHVFPSATSSPIGTRPCIRSPLRTPSSKGCGGRHRPSSCAGSSMPP